MGGECDRGSVVLAVVVPALFVLVFGAINVAWWYHARNVALAAARAGADAGRLHGSTTAGGAATALAFAARAGSGALQGPAVSTAGSSPATVCVTVTGVAPLIVPLVPDLHVTQRSCGPVEVFTR
jgi:Flp pilus assembly protein TadG